MSTNPDYDPDAPIPTTIPAVVVDDNGEPAIVQERLIKASPVPRGLAAFLILSALVSGFFIIKGDRDRAHDRDAFKEAIKNQQADFQSKIDEQIRRLDVQQDLATEDRDALRNLILALLTTDDPEKARQLLEDFTKDQQARNQRSSSSRNGTARPTPSPQVSPRPTPDPRPTSQPTRNPTPRPTATSSPTPPPGTVTMTVCTPQVPLVGSKCVRIG